MQNIAYSTFGLESAILEEVTYYESVTDSERGEFPPKRLQDEMQEQRVLTGTKMTLRRGSLV
jgi:hypothetical protein